MEGNNMEGAGHGARISPALSILLVVVIVLGGYFWFHSAHTALAPAPATTAPASHIQVIQSPKVSGGTTLSLPAGWPSTLPVEAANVVSSQVVNYKDHNVSASTLSYTSSKSAATLWKMYSDYMKANGYTVDPAKTSQANGDIVGTKGNNELSISISTGNKLSLVAISAVTRP